LSANEAGVSFDELVAGISSPDVRTIFEEYILPGRLGELEGQPVGLELAYVTAMKDARPKLIQRFDLLFKEHQLDAIIHPTTPDLAIKSDPAASSFEAFARMIRNADPASNAGMPGISLPAGLSQQEGLPVGIEIEGLPGSDGRLLSLAKIIESILGRGPTPKRSV
jgi:mandelamide amidase